MTNRRAWRPRIAALAVLAVALSMPTPARAFGKNKIAYQRFDWHVYPAPHFDVYYYPEEEALLDEMVSFAESQYLRLSQIFDHEIKFRIPLIFYKTHSEFEQTNIVMEFLPEYVGAFAEPIEHRVVIPADRPPDKLYQLIGHELTHVFEFSILFQESMSRAFRAQTPTWLMEGLASHVGQDEDSLDKMVIRDAVVSGIIPPIHRLNVLSFLTYRFGQAAFDFIEERYGPEGIRSFLWEYRKSLLTNNIAKPIKDAFGVEAEEFDRQFKRYLQQKYLPSLLEKKDAEDYGREIATRQEKEREAFWFSPALSPSGELLAVMTTRWQDLDVAIVSAKDGKIFRNLTKGFTNKYEYLVYGAFEGKKDITWSPEGDRVAFFGRKENERVLLIHNALNGRLQRVLGIPDVDDELSPAWSPDGRTIAFEGNQRGTVDIFTCDLESGAVRNLTQDEFWDGNPSWSPDGRQVLYNRRIGAYTKVFLVDASDPTRKVQLTFGDHSDLQPSFSRDAKTVYYVSDQDGGIFNLYMLDLGSGEIRRLTDVVSGVFTPLELPEEGGRTGLAFTTYSQGRFRLFRMQPGEPVAIERPADQAREPAEIEPFQPPVRLTLDEEKKKRYDKLKWHVDNAPNVLVGVADDGTVLSNAQVIVSDLLGDHRFIFNFQSVSTFSNFYFDYLNRKNRWQWDIFAQDFRDFYVFQSPVTGGSIRDQQARSYTDVGADISYPFNRYYRITGEVAYRFRSVTRPVYDFQNQSVSFSTIKESYPTVGWGLSGDTTRYKEFGPYHGQRFQFLQQWAPTVSFSGEGFESGTFVNTFLDYRLYRRLTARSLFATRLFGMGSNGKGYDLFPWGGLNQLRGYPFREFFGSRVSFLNLEYRFPLVDAIAFPFGLIRNVRAFLFFDVGAAWGGERSSDFFHPDIGLPLSNAEVSGYVLDAGGNLVPRRFKFWDSENGKLGDGRATYGFGWNFFLGPFQLTWSFAKRMENTVEVCDISGDNTCDPQDRFRVDDFHRGGTISSFYISTEF